MTAAFDVMRSHVGLPSIPLWLFTSGTLSARPAWAPASMDAGVLGLARQARSEALTSAPVLDLDESLPAADAMAGSASSLGLGYTGRSEPEVAFVGALLRVPRLAAGADSISGPICLCFDARGAISNLRVMSQDDDVLAAPIDTEVRLHVRAVGLNFRDVLNVLGVYPGDPGMPGSDCSAILARCGRGVQRLTPGDAVLGHGLSALASNSRSDSRLIAAMGPSLSFEQACTLPTTWCTVHMSLLAATCRAGEHALLQAGAGGVGLAAGEYAHWLNIRVRATAGHPHKHMCLHRIGFGGETLSSRDGGAFACGSAALMQISRLRFVLNSLSLDFIAVSVALLCEGSYLLEIGKRAVWSGGRSAVASAAKYVAIALDTTVDSMPEWMCNTLQLMSVRAGAQVLHGLPSQCYQMQHGIQAAFRSLQSGASIGKVVVCIPSAVSVPPRAMHMLTGGTGGLGLLTGRWLGESGARLVVLAARGGTVSAADGSQLARLRECRFCAMRCDAADALDVRRLTGGASCDGMEHLAGIWHAAGVLSDGLLRSQTAGMIRRVYAPKVHGGRWAHQACAGVPLDACVLFSSIAALFGGGGQSNYAAANSCLDALSVCRRVRGIPSTSVQWGPWADVGMAAVGSINARVQASGLGLIELAQGVSAFRAALSGGPAVMSLVVITWRKYLSLTPEVPPFLQAYAFRKPIVSETNVHEHKRAISLEAILAIFESTVGGSVDADAPVMEAGLDSLGAVELGNQLQQASGETLPSTLTFDYPTARQLAGYFNKKSSADVQIKSQGPHTVPPSASRKLSGGACLSGMKAILPGRITSFYVLGRMSSCGSDLTSEVPLDRWSIGVPESTDSVIRQRIRHGAFLSDAELFDNAFFSVSPAEAGAMDPQQRLLLECGYAALHGALLLQSSLMGSITGVFLGIAANDFADILRSTPSLNRSVCSATGSSHSIASGRISYLLGLNGPCISLDTACSAALAANHSALRALQREECIVALSLGVSMMLLPGVSFAFATAGMLSAGGHCHTFDARADGYVRSEACCAVTLRECGGDEEDLQLVGSCVRQDGKSASLTAPNGQAQQGLLWAALADAAMRADAVALVEAHGTGTALGDPIESRAVAALLHGRDSREALALSSVKANKGHAEPCAGISGLLSLCASMLSATTPPNSQLRSINPHVKGALEEVACALPVQHSGAAECGTAIWRRCTGGVDSFGYSGTIVHAILHSRPLRAGGKLSVGFNYTKRRFRWREHVHPLAQRALVGEADPRVGFRSPASGALRDLVADHIVQGRIVFPGAGYLEMVRAACGGSAALQERVLFLQPLLLDEAATTTCIACDITAEKRFDIRTELEDGSLGTAHCGGSLTAWLTGDDRHQPCALVLKALCVAAVNVASIYFGFRSIGIEYGPQFRKLAKGYLSSQTGAGVGRLHRRTRLEGTRVHPADLDAALQLTALIADGPARETRLPFSMATAALHSACGRLWSFVERRDASSVAASLVREGARADDGVRIDGFETRAIRVSPSQGRVREQPKDLNSTGWQAVDTPVKGGALMSSVRRRVHPGASWRYAVDWPPLLDGTDAADASLSRMGRVAVVGDTENLRAELLGIPCRSGHDMFGAQHWDAVVLAAVSGRGGHGLQALQLALNLVHWQVSTSSPAPIWMCTNMAQPVRSRGAARCAQGGLWGCARSCRTEMRLPLFSLDMDGCDDFRWVAKLVAQSKLQLPMGSVHGLRCSPSVEDEAVIRGASLHVGRLVAPLHIEARGVRLGLPRRGAISDLIIEVQTDLEDPLQAWEIELHVQAVGLNFRDVLIVLDQYPGPKAEPGTDCSGMVVELGNDARRLPVGSACFGFAYGCLASRARTHGCLQVLQPDVLSSEAAATLISTWGTVHIALGRLRLRAGSTLLLHAAAGGVGLAAMEYALWLHNHISASAGARWKHRILRRMGASCISSSRDPEAGALALLTFLRSARVHAVLNSLTADFIAVASAAVAEGCGFGEIGKRQAWGDGRAAAAAIRYHVLDMAGEVARCPQWFLHSVLEILARRVGSAVVHGLPIFSFDLVSQAKAAFRFLARGQHVGKVVVCPGVAHVSPELSIDFEWLSHQLDVDARRRVSGIDGVALTQAYVLLESLCRQFIGGALDGLSPTSASTWHHKLLFGWCKQRDIDPDQDRVEAKDVEAAHEGVWPELSLAMRCGPHLQSVLRGSTSYQELLFPGGSMEAVLPVYEDAVMSGFHNDTVVAAIDLILSTLQRAQLLRVIEVGAGTGGTTASVLPSLEYACAQYSFTDVSEVFLRQAQYRFAPYSSFMQYELLNIDADPRLQGFAINQYDVAIATNVLHATPSILSTLRNCRQLLCPGGILLVNEALVTSAFAQITFGLTDGWWLFRSDPARTGQGSPLMSWEHWRALFHTSGFAYSHAVREGSSMQVQAVMLARAGASRCGGSHVNRCGSQLISGGLGGLGLLTVRLLVKRGHQQFVLASRSGRVQDGSKADWGWIAGCGARVATVRCDTSDGPSVVKLVQRVLGTSGRLGGIYHAAGVLADAAVVNQSSAHLRAVFGPKVVGGISLHASSLQAPLSAFVAYSSLAGVFGSAGQMPHAAANTWLDSLVHFRRRLGGVSASGLQWGAVSEIGYAARHGADKRAATSGIGLVTREMASEALSHALSSTASVVAVFSVDWSHFLSGKKNIPGLLLAWKVRKSFSSAVASDANAARAQCETIGLQEVLEMVRQTIGGTSVDPDAPLMEAGLDSLGATELRNSLQRVSASEIPSTIVFDHPTARQLSEHLQGAIAPSILVAKTVTSEHLDDGLQDPVIKIAQFHSQHRCLIHQRRGKAGLPIIVGVSSFQGTAVLSVPTEFQGDVYGLEHEYISSGCSSALLETSLGELARKYARILVDELRIRPDPETPYFLLGGSFGSFLAHHIAAQAQQLGKPPAGLVLIEPFPVPPLTQHVNFAGRSPMTMMSSALASTHIESVCRAALESRLDDDMPSSLDGLTDMYASQPEDIIPFLLTRRLSDIGMMHFSIDSILQNSRRVAVCKHHSALCYEPLGQCMPAISEGMKVLLVFASAEARESIYSVLFGVTGEANLSRTVTAFYGSAVTNEIHVNGTHDDVVIPCQGNQVPEFAEILAKFIGDVASTI
jgi:NADPH:quinone reductase-like Zn-dependent oxidoreductase/3-oxoacyl-(acyl-carrier-protein) synthase/NAD(P)-dependent dehydrogenase (short-subunit alcohol dehydrogenase family)/SAM-dependent methyltransferase/acyl carrier protein